MLEKLFEFLINQEARLQESNTQLQLWKQKKEFLETFLADYLLHWRAVTFVTDAAASNEQIFYKFKDVLNEKYQKIRLDDIRLDDFGVLSEISESQLNDFWAKLFKDNAAQIHYFKDILSTHYIEFESIHPESIILYLKLLIIYYTYLAKLMPFSITVRVDFFMTQLVRSCLIAIMEFEKIGMDSPRTSKGNYKKTLKKGARKQIVIEEYHRMGKKSHLTHHRIAVLINERIKKRGETPPHPDTIKTYLREENLI